MTNRIEGTLVDIVARVAPWCAPLPTAYLVSRATIVHLAWPLWVGVVAGVIVESLGLASVHTALTLREYNTTRRKSDPAAPFVLSAALVAVYLVAALGLTIALDTVPGLAHFAPAVFPALSLTGVTLLAIRADHKARLATIQDGNEERRAARRETQAARRVHAEAAQAALVPAFACATCGASFAKQQGLAAHYKHEPAHKANGKAHDVVVLPATIQGVSDDGVTLVQ